MPFLFLASELIRPTANSWEKRQGRRRRASKFIIYVRTYRPGNLSIHKIFSQKSGLKILYTYGV